MKKHYKYLISGGYGLGNFGDDALMVSLDRIFRARDMENDFGFFCRKSIYQRREISNPIFSIFRKQFPSCDYFVLGGGTLFYTFKGTSVKKPKVLLWAKNPERFIRDIFIALGIWAKPGIPEIKKGEIAVGIGIGPFESQENTYLSIVRRIKAMKHVIVRDKISEEWLQEWKANNFSTGTDICFYPELWDISPATNKKSNRKIGIVLRDWTHNKNGLELQHQIFRATPLLMKQGYEVYYILLSTRDVVWKKKLKKERQKFLQWNPYKQNIEDFMNELKGFDLIVTSRYHGAVFSAILNIPFISICIEPKLTTLSKLFPNSCKLWHSPFKPDELLSATNEIFNLYSTFKNRLIQDLVVQENKAQDMINHFFELTR